MIAPMPARMDEDGRTTWDTPGSCAASRQDLHDFYLAGWLVHPSLDRVTCDGSTVRIRPQLMDVLVYLAARAGTTVTRQELLAGVWRGRFVSESCLSRCVAELRRALGDSARQPRIIETIPKRGYRLVAPVTWLPAYADGYPWGAGGSRLVAVAAGLAAVAPGATPACAAPRRWRFHRAVSRLRSLAIGLGSHFLRRRPAR